MVQTLVLNKSNIVSGSNNTQYKYRFKSDVTFKAGSKMAIQKLSFYYSWANITSAYGNNSFSYMWFDTSGNLTKTYSVTVQDGYYSIDDINDYLYSVLISRGHYLTFASSANVRGHSNGASYSSSTKYIFLKLLENSTYYSCQLQFYALPVYVGSSPPYTKPADVTGYEWQLPSSTTVNSVVYYKAPKLTFGSGMATVLGFNANTLYGSGSNTNSSGYEDVLSVNTPELCPVSSVLVCCSMIKNKYGEKDTLVTSFSATVDYGSLIDVEPNNLSWVNIVAGTYSEFTISLYDQSWNQMVIKDSNNVILMVIDEVE